MLSYPTPLPGGGLYVIWLSDEDEPHYYGGRTTSFKRRWRSHLRDLEAGKHDNDRMQNTFNKYGVFRPEVLVRLKPREHVETEQEWLDTHYGKVGCVNLSPCSAGGSGGHTEATRRKMSKTRASCPVLVQKARESLAVNRCTDVETLRVNVLAAIESNVGRPQSQATIEKRAAAHRGRKNTRETLALMSASAKRRAALQPTVHTDDTKAQISSQQRGRIWINNGTRNRRMFPEEADPLLQEGWVRGKLGSNTKGYEWIHRNGKQKRVGPKEVDTFLADGWIRGTLKKQKGLWIHRPGTTERKRVTPDDVDTYLAEGWVRGVGKTRKVAWVNRDGVKKRIPAEEVDAYLDDGWSRGSGDTTVGKRLWAHRFTADGTLERKRVPKAELPLLLESGWIRGTGPQG